MEEIVCELKSIGIRLLFLIFMTPLMGYGFLRIAEKYEKDWKSGSRRKKWMVMCGVFFIIAGIGGWLR